MSKGDATVGQVMSKDVLAVDLNTNSKACARAMMKKGVSCAVITESGSAVGIVTERDLVSKVLAESIEPNKVLVRDIMSTPLITTTPDTALVNAAEVMAQYRIRRLVVVDSTGTLSGIVTAGDIARSLAEKQQYRDATLNAVARYSERGDSGPYQ
ncbi:MAG: CBS domain-containing protein [Nitrososphaerota archaeon]|nr:CBS domain-containing protein [Nitrososphaerota archaeon]MDG7024617.1 CBS domain-containing protein [Nitrososphaerota archaeon]